MIDFIRIQYRLGRLVADQVRAFDPAGSRRSSRRRFWPLECTEKSNFFRLSLLG